MSIKGSKTVTSGMDWNTMLGLLVRLRNDGRLREHLLIAMGCYFGLRASDLLNLKWVQVLNSDKISVVDEFIIIEGKTKKSRRITLNNQVKEVLRYCAEKLIDQGIFDINDCIFNNRYGKKISIQYINKTLHSTFTEYNVNVQNGSTHTLRKTFGKRVWEMDGKSERSLVYLSEIFSHSSIATTKKYIGITEQQIADVYLKL